MFSSNATQVSSAANYIEDVFSTYLYTGNASTQTITNNIDFSTYGGLAWIKRRDQAGDNQLFDTVRGATKYLVSNSTAGQATGATKLTSFTTSGYVLGADGNINGAGDTYASWSFRKQAKFFDVVTYTGNGANRDIAHNLGSTPAVIFVKQISSVQPWAVYHRSLSSGDYLLLNTTAAVVNDSTYFTTTAPTSTTFRVGTANATNANAQTYVAYLFAHNAGGFGLTGTDNVISCGSFTTDGSGNATVNLGYEPAYLNLKCATAVEGWILEDTMRGANYSATAGLFANTSGAEFSNTPIAIPTATGFVCQNGQLQVSQTYIYIAIRRGPMKVPTSGTSVFAPSLTTTNDTITTNFPVDLSIFRTDRAGTQPSLVFDRLRGQTQRLSTSSSGAEATATAYPLFDSNTGTPLTGFSAGLSGVDWAFRRAPSFFDEVCYTGDDNVGRTVNHNLGVVPELMIFKSRNNVVSWTVYASAIGPTKALILDSTSASANTANFNSTSPTASVFTLGGFAGTNAATYTYVAYLFATCAGVSKVGSYTGTGTTQQINCGFTGGARFILIKRTDSTGDWYVYDSARGIVAGNDPYLFWNSSAAEVTNTDYVDTYSAGFEISSTAPAAINASGGTFIFLAIA